MLGSLILPFLEYFNVNGYFRILDAFKDTLKKIAIDYTIYGIGGLIILIILAGGGYLPSDADALTVIAVSCSNIGGQYTRLPSHKSSDED